MLLLALVLVSLAAVALVACHRSIARALLPLLLLSLVLMWYAAFTSRCVLLLVLLLLVGQYVGAVAI